MNEFTQPNSYSNPNLDKPKATGKTIAIVILTILVVGLAAFSAFLFLNRKATTDQAAENKTESVEPEPVKNEPQSTVAAGGPYIADNYLYVPEWNVKYKLSDELTDYGYSVSQDSLGSSFGKYVLGLTAFFKKDLIEEPQARYYATIDTCSLITVTRTEQDASQVGGPKKVIKSGNISYVIYDYRAHGGCIQDSHGSFSEEQYDPIVEKLIDIVSNPEPIQSPQS